ncbi:TonB-dependent receptor [Granulicella sp. WH15]|uniref:TonB-dependent receptor n=1 Tax=Granulicella sp. WH15 TaxID=2602070 RepID=UPI002101EDDD|nr:TonB-dependent receptor [Granulicella sp. WH15]
MFPVFLAVVFFAAAVLRAQSGGSSGTISGTVLDPSGAAIPGATVVLQNDLSGVNKTVTTDASGEYQFTNIAFNPYRLSVVAKGFGVLDLRVSVRSSVPIVLTNNLKIANSDAVVTVEAGGDLVENSSTFHSDIDRELFTKLPLESKSSSVSSLITLASPGVSADSNGLFHGLGDHAENAFYVDGQPITDQQSKVFSNQLPISSIQSLEVISGAPPAEYGEKTSLVANIVTRSGQGTGKPRGEVVGSYGTFGSSSISTDLAEGTQTLGNFSAVDFLQTGRFLDPSEFAVFHDKGNVTNLFDRIDFAPTKADSLHLNLEYTRSWFQTPNSYDNLNVQDQFGNVVGDTDQRAKIGTFNIAPSMTHVVNPQTILTFGGWVRRDDFNYYPSKNPLADFQPLQQETVSQTRSLMNAGVRADINYVAGIHNIKLGGTYQSTFLNEQFGLGIVDPTLNSPCLNASGQPVSGFTSPADCAASGLFPNTIANPLAATPYNPVLACFDLTRPSAAPSSACVNGTSTSFQFVGHADIKLLSFYGEDSITKGNFSFNVGIRGDLYNGLSSERQAEPRVGLSYNVKQSGTVVRASYARTLETPFNENLVLSSKGCESPVIAALVPCIPATLTPGFRNEFHAGFEQSAGKHFVVTGDYIWKYTHNAYDFSVLGATPITFPIAWHNSKISGFAIRATVPQTHGFSAFVVMSSVSARFFPAQIGGLGATNTSGQPFRIDHDEKFNQTTHLEYQFKKKGPYISYNWRYDSGQVAGAVPFATSATTPVDLTGLSADEQQQAGLFCGNDKASLTNALTTCAPGQFGSTLLSIPAPGTENDDHNPPRIRPRNVFDLAVGEDDLLHRGPGHGTFSASLTVINLTNKYALYNFLSTFSGTHYLTPRALTAEVGYHF